MHSRGFVVFFPHKNAGLPNVCCMLSLCSSQGITPFFSSTNTSFSLSKTIHGLTFSNHFILGCMHFSPKHTVPQSNSRSLYSLHSWVRTETCQVSSTQNTSPHIDSSATLSSLFQTSFSERFFGEHCGKLNVMELMMKYNCLVLYL